MLHVDSLRLDLVVIAIVVLLAGCKETAAPGGPVKELVEQGNRPPKPEPAPKSSTPESRKMDGRWSKARVSADADADLKMQIRQLEAIGYASGTKTSCELLWGPNPS
jgi:hypothetical protein